jgi:hypothetical protein
VVVRRQRFRAVAILGLAVLVSACGGRTREHSDVTEDEPGESGAGGSTGAPAGGTGASANTGSAGNAGGSGSGHSIAPPGIGGSAGAPAIAGAGGTSSLPIGNSGGAPDATLDSSCGVERATPKTDPGFRGVRGTLNGEPFSAEDGDARASIPYCPKDGFPAEANLLTYVPLPGQTLWFGVCGAKVTSPDETDWHALETHLSADVERPMFATPSEDDFNPPLVVGPNGFVSGHVKLQGQDMNGPFVFEADFYLEVFVDNPCAPRVG